MGKEKSRKAEKLKRGKYNKISMSHETIVKKVNEDFNGSISQASKGLGIPLRTLRRWYKQPQIVNQLIKRYVITYAQNDTPVHQGFYDSLQHYLKHWRSELICYRGVYKNPTSSIEAEKSNPMWDSKLLPFLMDTVREINDNLVIYPARTNPTAVNPLTGYESQTGDKSGIFPHPKISLKTIATPGSKLPKILTTTGAITVKNYSKSKAGEKGKHHHVIGAIIVEVEDDKVFHIRHINAEHDGSFFDVAGGNVWKYTPNEIEKNHSIEVATFGDLHYPFIDGNAMSGGLDMIERLKPKKLVLHDCLDFWARNHHERGNRFLNTAKSVNGKILVEEEIDGLAVLLKTIARPKDYEILVVPSNHDEALDRWLCDENVDLLGPNAAYFHWLSYHKHKSAKWNGHGYSFINVLEFALREKLDADKLGIRFLKRDVSEIINNIEYAMHGDVGPSGSRGSSTNLSKIGVKSVVGHSHSPSIHFGCFQVGVKSVIPLGYAKGPNSWLHTDCITYPNGKRTLINHISGKWYLK